MTIKRKPDWLKIKPSINENFRQLRAIVRKHDLHTVCEEARCPNQGECWRNKTATIMILGESCTRNCRFCAVSSKQPLNPDYSEPEKVGKAVKLMGLKYCVITSVTRDDLNDGGAAIWAETIRQIKTQNPECKVEALIPDFKGSTKSLELVLEAGPDILGHNLETVKKLYPLARADADYARSLELIRKAGKLGAITKTGIMLGLGETKEQIIELMQDAIKSDCKIFTAGQYLQPTKRHLAVQRYITPKEFEYYRAEALKMGFQAAMTGPLVRSSYKAEELYNFCR